MLYELYIEDKFNYLQNRIKESVNVLHELIHSLDYKNYILDVTIQPPSKRIPFLGVFVNDM